MPKVYLSPSTQEKNTGPNGYNEEVMMNKVADRVEQLLKEKGIEVKRNDPNQSLGAAVRQSNAYKPDLHVSLHSNGYNQKVRGLEIWYNDKGKAAAEYAYNYLNKVVPGPNRGLKSSGQLYELRFAEAPAYLIEYDFHDVVEGAAFIAENIEKLAAATVAGICDYFDIENEEDIQTPDPEQTVKPHWAEVHYNSLNAKGIKIHDKRYDEPVTRAELFALLDRIAK